MRWVFCDHCGGHGTAAPRTWQASSAARELAAGEVARVAVQGVCGECDGTGLGVAP